MARLLGIVLAVIAGVAAVDSPPDAPARQAQLASAACHDALVDRTELAALAVLVCVAAASVSRFAGRELQPA